MTPELFGYGHAGPVSPACEVRLVDVPEANYLSSNETPQGEIWVRGATVTKGYWKREDLTSELLADGGWLQTGDIGEWKENGALAVIDRKKNLVKLSNGEYIALEKLESIYKSCVLVGNICIYADSLLPRAVALVVPAEKAIYALAAEKGVTEKDWVLLCGDTTIKKAVLAALLKQGKDAGLKPAEMLFDVYLCSEEWTSENVSISIGEFLYLLMLILIRIGSLDGCTKDEAS